MAIKVKFLTGSKTEIDNQIIANNIDAGDVVFTSDTDELIFIDPSVEKKVIKSKTQQPYVLQGVELGGLTDGSVIKEGTDIDELLKLITTKTISATYTQPTLEIMRNNNKEYEVGNTANITIYSQFEQNDAGALTAHQILQDGKVSYEGGVAPSIGNTYNLIITDSAITFESKAYHNAGEIKNNNLGEANPEGAIPAGILTSEPIVVQGYRKLFYRTGVGEIPELNSTTIRKGSYLKCSDKMDFIIDMFPGEQYIMFAYPAHMEPVNEITYVQMNDSDMLFEFEQALISVEGANGYEPIDYQVYLYKTAAPVSSKVTFNVKIGG